MDSERARVVDRDSHESQDQEAQEWAARRLKDPEVQRRLEELEARKQDGGSEDSGLTPEDLLDLARDQ